MYNIQSGNKSLHFKDLATPAQFDMSYVVCSSLCLSHSNPLKKVNLGLMPTRHDFVCCVLESFWYVSPSAVG